MATSKGSSSKGEPTLTERRTAVTAAREAIEATARGKARQAAVSDADREAIAGQQLVVVKGMGADQARAIGDLEGRAKRALIDATGKAWGATPNLDACKLAPSARVKGEGTKQRIGGRADVDAMRAHIAGYLADEANAGRGGRYSVTKAAKQLQPTMGGRFSWPLYQQLWGEATGDAVVHAKGDAMVAGIGYGGRDYGQRVASWAAEAGTPQAAALIEARDAFEAKRAARVQAEQAKAAEAAKVAKAAARREQAKAKRASTTKAPAARKATPKAPAAKATAAKRASKAAAK